MFFKRKPAPYRYTSLSASVNLLNSDSELKRSINTETFCDMPDSSAVIAEHTYMDIAKQPHVLIAGATGSGKSVTMHNIICSLMINNTAESAGFVMIDTKYTEFSLYRKCDFLLCPVINTISKASLVLDELNREMDRRNRQMSDSYCRNWQGQHIYICVDELADLMMQGGKKVQQKVIRIAQMGRSAGIHLILATQYPKADVIPVLLKANVPARIALRTATSQQSRMILDHNGAESLPRFHAYVKYVDGTETIAKVPYLSEEEIIRISEGCIVKGKDRYTEKYFQDNHRKHLPAMCRWTFK